MTRDTNTNSTDSGNALADRIDRIIPIIRDKYGTPEFNEVYLTLFEVSKALRSLSGARPPLDASQPEGEQSQDSANLPNRAEKAPRASLTDSGDAALPACKAKKLVDGEFVVHCEVRGEHEFHRGLFTYGCYSSWETWKK